MDYEHALRGSKEAFSEEKVELRTNKPCDGTVTTIAL